MTNAADWITARIAESREHHSSVTPAAAARMEELLRGDLREQQLSGAELERIAKALLADMIPDAAKAEGTPS